MSCRPIHVNLEIDPDATQMIAISLDKTCDADDQAKWKMSFELQEGNPLATVVKLDVEIDPENHPQAEATASDGLDDNQQGQAKIAAVVAKDPLVEQDDKKDAVQQVIAVKQLPAMAPAKAPVALAPAAVAPVNPV